MVEDDGLTDDVTLWHGDCLDLMARIPDGSVDAVITDLPYSTTACEWDRLIPFDRLWAEYRRLLSPKGSVVTTASQPFTSELIQSNRPWFKYCLVWEKSSAGGFLDAKFRPLKAHEDVVVFSPAGCSNGSKPAMTYNPQMTEGEPYARTGRRGDVGKASSRSAASRTSETISDGSRYPRSILLFPSEQRAIHPTQKPVALFEYMIKTYTDEGQTVLDNTMGSGTTGVACVRTGRKFIGIEQDAGYFEIAQRRIADELAKTALLTGATA